MTATETTNFTPEQIEEIEVMITNRIVLFHDHLIECDQISRPSPASRMVHSNRSPAPKLEVIKNEE